MANHMLIIAHRGESYEATENTLSAINLAWQRGVDGVEIDVQLSKDNEIIVFHNKKIKNSENKNVLVKFQTLEDLKKCSVGRTKNDKLNDPKIPTLSEVLLTIPQNKYLFIEIKCGIEIIPYLKKVLQQSYLKFNQIKIIGFGLKKMYVIKKDFPEHEVLLNKKIIINKIIFRNSYWDNLIKKLILNSLDGLNLSYSNSLNIKLIDKFKHNKLKIYVWTVNDPRRALRLIELCVDGFMSDRPEWIKEKITAI
jgi:glycerophosphoryl diester phosphodiesterase